jgi:hypothetical protein
MSSSTDVEYLQKIASTRWGVLVEVFYGVAGDQGKLKKGYWLREWTDATRQRFDRWGFLGRNVREAARTIKKVDEVWGRF